MSTIRRLLEDERVQDGMSQLGKAWDLIVGAIDDPKGALGAEVQKEAEEEDRASRTVATRADGVSVEVRPGAARTFCTGCGNRLIVSQKFCGSCGARV